MNRAEVIAELESDIEELEIEADVTGNSSLADYAITMRLAMDMLALDRDAAAAERARIADAIEAVADDEERTAIVGGVVYVQVNPCLATCAPCPQESGAPVSDDPVFKSEWEQLLATARKLAELVKKLLLAISNEAEGGRMSNMGTLEGRMAWYESLRPLKAVGRELLDSPAVKALKAQG